MQLAADELDADRHLILALIHKTIVDARVVAEPAGPDLRGGVVGAFDDGAGRRRLADELLSWRFVRIGRGWHDSQRRLADCKQLRFRRNRGNARGKLGDKGNRLRVKLVGESLGDLVARD
jgi:hypothetical protein